MPATNIGPILRAIRHNRTRALLILLEVAMTLAIVANCVNVILAERTRMSQSSGFDDDHIVRLQVRPFAPEFKDEDYLHSMVDRDLRTMESTSGVVAASNTSFRLWEGGGSSTQFFVFGTEGPPVVTQIYFGTDHLMQALGAELVEGRTFEPGDYGVGPESDRPAHAIISKTMSDLLFPGGSALGRTIQQGQPGKPSDPPVTVVGVIRDFYNPFGRDTSLAAHSDRVVFLPARVADYAGGMSYLIRTGAGSTRSILEQVEARLLQQNAGRVLEFKAVSEQRSRWFASSQIVVTTLSCIAAALVGVSALGLLGLTSLSVTLRQRQIGTRRALGAARGDILVHLLLENGIVTIAGLMLGIAGAFALNVLLVSRVSDAKLQWPVVASGVVLLLLNAVVSTLPPAFRAMAVPPSIATRTV